MRRSSLSQAMLAVGLTAASPLLAQQAGQVSPAWSSPGREMTPVTLPDSIRVRSGYHHWLGGAVGASVGGLGGLLLAIAGNGNCADCSSDEAPIGKATLIGAGLGGAFGFLVGSASPRYRCVPAESDLATAALRVPNATPRPCGRSRSSDPR